jgi:hypothetical protein
MLAKVRQRRTRWWEGESYPAFVGQGCCINVNSFVANVSGKKKVIKAQRRSKKRTDEKKEPFIAISEF